MTKRFSTCVALGLTTLIVAIAASCKGDSEKPAAGGARPNSAAATAQHVDSALPREVELERFRAGLGQAPTALSGGASSRDALVSKYVASLATRDTATLRTLIMSKAEFAWIYYPSNPIGKPPYDLSPGLMWFQMEGNSLKGLTHALAERGGLDLHVVGYGCDPVEMQGANKVYNHCALRRVQAKGDTLSEQLFGSILELNGVFKFVSYNNKL